MPTRRTVLHRTGLAVGGTTVLAGCGAGGDTGEEGIPNFDPDGRTLTVVVPTDAIPRDVELNPYALTPRGQAIGEPFNQLVLPAVAPTGEYLTDGHTWAVDGDEISVPCAVRSFEAEADGISMTFRDGLTYWNGDALDAEAFAMGDRLRWLALGDRDGEFPGDLSSATEYRWSMPDADSRAAIEQAIHPGSPPLPPSFTESWIEKLESASSQDERDGVITDLSSTNVDLETFVEAGYGSGAYRIESTDVISREGLGARRRDDHPADVSIPNLVVRTPRTDSVTPLIEDGTIDVGRGSIDEDGGDYQRSAVTGDVEQLTRYPSPVGAANQLFFNWESPHLRRLWVRRAFAAVLPFRRVVENVYGKNGKALEQHSGMLSGVARARLGSEFVDSLYQYPVDGDPETASEWMRRAGYTVEDEEWYDPDGERLSLTLAVAGAARSDSDSVESALSEFGVEVNAETLPLRPNNEFEPAITEGEFDLTLGFAPSGRSPGEYYDASAAIRGPFPFGPPTSIAGNPPGDCDSRTDWFSPPGTVTLPAETGSLRIDGASYDDGGTTYRHDGGDDVSICEALRRLRDTGTGEEDRREAARQCARWYNYALPNLVFAQERVGVFGDTADFTFPAETEALQSARPENWSPVQYVVQAGTVR